MAICWTIQEGTGVRVDGTDIWLVEQIIEDGTAAILRSPSGQLVTLKENIEFRVGPGFKMWIAPSPLPGSIMLVMESYTPIMHRQPPRDHKAKPVAGGAT
jgi:hypothetical protein